MVVNVDYFLFHCGLLYWKGHTESLVPSTEHVPQKKINNATGLNYLVREVGPALIGRSIALRAQSGNDTVVDNGDEYDGDDGNGESDSNDIAVPERKRKRKLVDNEK